VPPNAYRVVLDTNIVVRALINPKSISGRILYRCESREFIPLLSHELLSEYRAILKRPVLVDRYPQLKRPEIDVALERLMYVSDFYRRFNVRFVFDRDPKDAPLVELAIVGHATHIVTGDPDLLSLPQGRDDAARRFRHRLPHTQIVKPEDFLREQAAE